MNNLQLGAEHHKLLNAANNAAALLDAIYQHIDRVQAAGGATSISGIAACHAFLKSMETNRPRAEKLVMQPLRELLGR